MVECKNCKSTNTEKNGIKRKKQRYKCKECGYNFVIGNAHTSPQKMAKKALVVLLYSIGKWSYSMLAKIFGVSNGTIHNWVVEVAKALPDAEIPPEIKEIEFDEMWHFIGKKTKIVGHQSR
jgi:transposase-like protein